MQRKGTMTLAMLVGVLLAGCGGPQKNSAADSTKDSTGPVTTDSVQQGAQAAPVAPQPEGMLTVTPGLIVDDVDAALGFYTSVLGGQAGMVFKTPDGKMTLHAEVKLGDAVIMLGPAMEAMGARSPKMLGGTPASLTYYVEDVDGVVKKAVAAGARLVMPVADQFWGDRYGQIEDPSGHLWGIATHKEEIDDAEMSKRAAAVVKAMQSKGGAQPKFTPGKPATSYIPEGYHTVTPGLVVKNGAALLDFYQKAFGARERMRVAMPDGRIMHAELAIGDSIVMISDEMPEFGSRSPLTLDGTPFSLMMYVPDVDSAFEGAVQAGARAKQPVMDMFWGDRYGEIFDPSGHMWGLATHKKDLTPAEIQEAMEQYLRSAGPKAPAAGNKK